MTRFLKTYRIVLWIVLLALIVPLLLACIYNRPMADDLYYLKENKKAEPQLHSALDVIACAASRAHEMWTTISGTFGAFFLLSLIWYVFKETLPHFYLAATLVVLLGACFQVARCLRCARKDLPRAATDCLALLTGIMLVAMMPSAFEGFFWIAGTTYTLGFAIMVYLFGSLLYRCLQNKKPSLMDGIYLFFMCLAFFLLGGGDHLSATSALVLYGFFALWVLVSGKPKRYLLPFAFLLAGYLLCVFAPGNAVRQEGLGEHVPLLTALAMSFIQAIRFVFWDSRYWAFLVLCLPAVIEVAARFSCSFKHVVITLLASLAVLASCFFPTTYAGYTASPRHINFCFLMLCPLLIANLTVFVSYGLHALPGLKAADGATGRLHLPAGQAAALMGVALVSLGILSMPGLELSPLRLHCVVPSVRAVSNLLDGQLRTYAEEYDDIVALLKASPNELVIAPCPYNDLLGTPDLIGDPLAWKNADFAAYYGGGENSMLSCY